MRRLEDVLRDLAEQDQQLSTDELITRIEQGLSGGVDSSVVAMPRRSTMETIERTTQMEPKRRRNPVAVTAGAAVLLLLIVGLPLLLLRGGDSAVIDEPTTTQAPVTTTVPDAPLEPGVTITADAWGRVGGEIMNPVVGLFDMAAVGGRLVAVGFDPGTIDFRQNGVVLVSEDGVTWERFAESDQALTKGTVLIYGISAGGPGMVAVGTGCEDDTEACPVYPTVWTSTDGTSWARSATDPAVFTESGAMLDVVATEDGLVAAGNVGEWLTEDTYVSRPAAWFSVDSLDWSPPWTDDPIDSSDSLFLPGFVSLAAGPEGETVGVGMAEDSAGNIVAAVWLSLDGRSWERIDADSAIFAGQNDGDVTMNDVAWTADGYIAVGSEDGTAVRVWLSPDGLNWSLADTADSFANIGTLSSVAAIGSGYVAAGPHGWTDQTDPSITLWTSPDGAHWDPVLTAGQGYVSEIVANASGIALAGAFPSEFDVHAGVWAGPSFDPANPPSAPETVTFAMPVSSESDGDVGGGDPIDPADVAGAEIGDGDPDVATPGDNAIALDAGVPRLALGERTDVPATPRWDFLASLCWDTGCGREPSFADPLHDGNGTSVWLADEPFHIRHGFVNESTEPLSNDFDVKVFITRWDGPALDEIFELEQTYEFSADYVVSLEAEKCGPGYWEQTESSTCEQYIHEFSDGLPGGRYDIWVGWYAPCSAWLDLGIVDSCTDPNEISWEFQSAVNSPLMGVEFPEDWQGDFDTEALFADPGDPLTWGW